MVYKKLLGEGPLGLADLAEAFPALGRSLAAVMAMEPEDVEDTLCRWGRKDCVCGGGGLCVLGGGQ